jgi:hypothetical protein
MRRWLSLATGVGLLVALTGNLTAQTRARGTVPVAAQTAAPPPAQAPAAASQQVRWVAASGGVIPAGALAYGHDASGRQEFACRGAVANGSHIGRIASGISGCSIAIGGREVIIPTYEVLASASTLSPAATSGAAQVVSPASPGRDAARQTAATGRVGAVLEPPQVPQRPPDTPAQPDSIRRGFDDDGNPYYEVTLVDGSIRRTLNNGGVLIIRQDGTQQYYRPQYSPLNAPVPNPPALPDDATRGRNWVQRHNEELLAVIRTLVKNNDAEMQKFTAAETKSAGTDMFKQIWYRTTVASFLAGAR